MTIFEDIRSAYENYLIWLRSNPRLRLPENQHDPEKSIGKVHASSLGRCPRANAMKRQGDYQEKSSALHLMQQGVRDAEPIQEALVWDDPMNTQVELSVERPFKDGYIRGRMDALFKGHIIELKRRDGFRNKTGGSTPPNPKLTDIYQMLAYGWITGNENLILLLSTRFEIYLWNLVKHKEGFVLVDENGKVWSSKMNRPDYLNYDVMLAEASRQLDYIMGRETKDPMPNFLNAHNGYECFDWESDQRPKKFAVPFRSPLGLEMTGVTANIIPTCPFWCHGPVPDNNLITVEEIEIGSGQYKVKDNE